MQTIQIIATSHENFHEKFSSLLQRGAMDMQDVFPKVQSILNDVRQRGDTALLEHIKQFDKWSPQSLQDIIVPPEQMQKAYQELDDSLKAVLHTAYERIHNFCMKQMPKSWIDFDDNGNILGQKITALNKAGLYIPGGKAVYPSSLLMNAIPAAVAGVKEIMVCSPASSNHVDSFLLAAAHLCKVSLFCKVGGASAIGLMAYGSQSFKKADIISGPGNIFVATAKKLVFGDVFIDMIAGPSEIGVIADSGADAKAVALDMLSQAEHDELASAILITPSQSLAQQVAQHINEQLPMLSRKDIASSSIYKRGIIIIAKDIEESIQLMNNIAPEHLELMVSNPFALLPYIQNAGAIFLGDYTPEALGDYLAGPNHTLPTGGSAKFFSPLSVEHFLKKSSLLAFSQKGALELSALCGRFAEAEGLDAHKESIFYRKILSKNR